jgi:hypothetical protein
MLRFGRAFGPRPLVFDARIARKCHELSLYIRQSHAESDLEELRRKSLAWKTVLDCDVEYEVSAVSGASCVPVGDIYIVRETTAVWYPRQINAYKYNIGLAFSGLMTARTTAEAQCPFSAGGSPEHHSEIEVP